MEATQLGSAGPVVSRIGLGCMSMSGVYGPADRAESIATIHAALDAGIKLLDTGTSTARATTSCWSPRRFASGTPSRS